MVAEGVRCSGEALRADCEIRLAVVSPRLGNVPGGPELEARLRRSEVKCVAATDRELAELSDTTTSQGVLLLCGREQVALHALSDGAGILVLDGVQDPGNVGTLVRSAHAFGFGGVVALRGTADPWGAKALRASAGSVFHVPIATATAEELVDWAEHHGIGLKVAEARSDRTPNSDGVGEEMDPGADDSSWALVIGNEGVGVSDEIRRVSDDRVGVVIRGAESLNAGVAGSILMYEYTKKLGGGR